MTATGRLGGAGETLVELLVSITILGIAGAGVIGVVMMGTSASVMHEEMTATGRILRNWAESLERTDYELCATRATVSVPPEPTGWAGGNGVFTRTIKGVTYTARVGDVSYWDTSSKHFTGSCQTDSDSGLQRYPLSVHVEGTGMGGTTEDLVLTRRNPCRSVDDQGCA